MYSWWFTAPLNLHSTLTALEPGARSARTVTLRPAEVAFLCPATNTLAVCSPRLVQRHGPLESWTYATKLVHVAGAKAKEHSRVLMCTLHVPLSSSDWHTAAAVTELTRQLKRTNITAGIFMTVFLVTRLDQTVFIVGYIE